ncbi:MAG: PP2C family protein-serine/threonine phosphatase [Eubacteriales bacterium]
MKELQMKMTSKSVRLWRTLESWLANPGFAHLVGSMHFLLLGFVLSGASLFGTALPLACALVATTTTPIFALAGLLGSCVGYLYFWGVSGGLQWISLCVLIFATICTLGSTNLGKTAWFLPLFTSCMAAMVGLLFLLQIPFTVELVISYVLNVSISGGMVYGFQMAKKRGKSGYSLLFLGCCGAGLGGLALVGDVNFGHFFGFCLVSAALGTSVALPLGAVLGLAVDCANQGGFHYTALFVAVGLCSQLDIMGRRPVGQLMCLVVTTLYSIFMEPPVTALLPVAGVAVLAGLLVPPTWFQGWGQQRTILNAQGQLEDLGLVFAEISQNLTREIPKESKVPLSSIFDCAAEEVCGNCPLWSQCWKQKGSDTFHLFCAAVPAMVQRGQALREDFPPEFARYCTDFSRLLCHINSGLEAIAGKKQYQNRLAETRTAVAEQYGFLASYCQRTGDELGLDFQRKRGFKPEFAVKTAKKVGNETSGDRVSAFYCGDHYHCVILCDGMGSGENAAEEAQLATDTLKGLLQAGLPPEYGLEFLNYFYILRGTGCFSTVDLLWMDLHDGKATLYKWGTAPSYCKGSTTYKLGSVTPPPGLGVGEKHRPQTVGLTMERGQTVILLSDGIEDGAVARLISGWRVCPPYELANAILEEAKSTGEDDMTAVVVTLRHRSSDF